MTSKRIVVVRDYEQLNAEEAAPIAAVLADLARDHRLRVRRWGGEAAESLADALKGAEVVGPDSEKTVDVLAAELERADLTLAKDGPGPPDRLGDDAGAPRAWSRCSAPRSDPARRSAPRRRAVPRRSGLGPGLPADERDRGGQGRRALSILDRLLNVTSARQPKPMHPLQVLGLLQSRYRKLLRLDDPGDPHDQGRARRARRQGQHVPGAEGARGVNRAGDRRSPAGDRLPAPGGPRPQGRERDAGERGARGARRPPFRAAVRVAGLEVGPGHRAGTSRVGCGRVRPS